MEKIKNDLKKWLYWFLLGLAIIVVYNIFNNFDEVMGVLGRFFDKKYCINKINFYMLLLVILTLYLY